MAKGEYAAFQGGAMSLAIINPTAIRIVFVPVCLGCLTRDEAAEEGLKEVD